MKDSLLFCTQPLLSSKKSFISVLCGLILFSIAQFSSAATIVSNTLHFEPFEAGKLISSPFFLGSRIKDIKAVKMTFLADGIDTTEPVSIRVADVTTQFVPSSASEIGVPLTKSLPLTAALRDDISDGQVSTMIISPRVGDGADWAEFTMTISGTRVLPINHGLFIGAYDPGPNTQILVDFRQNAKTMKAAFAARTNTKAYILTGDLTPGSNGKAASPITVSMISKKLQSIRSKMRLGDSLTLYINNHGGSLVPGSSVIKDTGVGDDLIMTGEYLVDNTLADLLSQFNGFRVEVFLDSCHGGGFWGGSDLKEATGYGYDDLNQLSNIALYSGAAEDKLEFTELGYSLSHWGRALLEAFKKPVPLSSSKLADFLETRTLEIAKKSENLLSGVFNKKQEPPVWYTLALGDLVQPDTSLIETFVTSSVDFDMSAISLTGPDPLLQINTLTEAVASINPGKSLFNKMTDVQAYYEVGDIVTACSPLNGFINEVKAQSGKTVPVDDAEQLIASAEFIMATFECH